MGQSTQHIVTIEIHLERNASTGEVHSKAQALLDSGVLGAAFGHTGIAPSHGYVRVVAVPQWLHEAVLSMEHDHVPAVRYCGDRLRARIRATEGK